MKRRTFLKSLAGLLAASKFPSIVLAENRWPVEGPEALLVQAIGGDVWWRDDGTDPEIGKGIVLKSGDLIYYKGDPRRFVYLEEPEAELMVVPIKDGMPSYS